MKTDIKKIAEAIEADAGQALPGLRSSLNEMVEGQVGRVYTPEQILVRSVRVKTGMTQREFAALIQTPVQTLRDWEQGRVTPSGSVMCLMTIFENCPETIAVLQAKSKKTYV